MSFKHGNHAVSLDASIVFVVLEQDTECAVVNYPICCVKKKMLSVFVTSCAKSHVQLLSNHFVLVS